MIEKRTRGGIAVHDIVYLALAHAGTGQDGSAREVHATAGGSLHVVHDSVGSKGHDVHTSSEHRAAAEIEGLHGIGSSCRVCDSENANRAQGEGTTTEAVFNKMQQWFSDTVQAEASRTSEAQVAQQDILQKIHTALDSMSTRATRIEETE